MAFFQDRSADTLVQVVVLPLPWSPTNMMMLFWPFTGCHAFTPGSISCKKHSHQMIVSSSSHTTKHISLTVSSPTAALPSLFSTSESPLIFFFHIFWQTNLAHASYESQYHKCTLFSNQWTTYSTDLKASNSISTVVFQISLGYLASAPRFLLHILPEYLWISDIHFFHRAFLLPN